MEFTVRSSPGVLFQRLSTASGLADWFADDVTIDRHGIYHFQWDGSEEEAELVKKKSGEFVQFRWVEGEDDSFFEFRLRKDPLTGDLALMITDFVDPDEEEESRRLWESQVSELKRILGN